MTTKLIAPRRGEDIINGNFGTSRFNDYLERAANLINQDGGQVVENTAGIATINSLVPVFVTTNSNRLVGQNETVNCTNGGFILITLMLSPINNQRIEIKRANQIVSISGNGKLIDGLAGFTLLNKGDAVTLIYSTDAGYWSAM